MHPAVVFVGLVYLFVITLNLWAMYCVLNRIDRKLLTANILAGGRIKILRQVERDLEAMETANDKMLEMKEEVEE